MEKVNFEITAKSVVGFNKVLNDFKLLPNILQKRVEKARYIEMLDTIVYNITVYNSDETIQVFGDILEVNFDKDALSIVTKDRIFHTKFKEIASIKSI